MNTHAPLSTHTPVAAAVQQLLGYSRLPSVIEEFQTVLQAEQQRRERFYEEITEEQKVEFINGEVIVHSPVKLRHALVSQNIFTLLNIYVRKRQLGLVGHEKWLITLTRNDYEPDIVYFGSEKAQTFTLSQMKFPAPDLIVEVLSPSTQDRDRGLKFRDYAAHNVLEYWIVDPDLAVIEQYVLQNTQYILKMKSDSGMLRSVAVTGFEIAISVIFDETAPFLDEIKHTED